MSRIDIDRKFCGGMFMVRKHLTSLVTLIVFLILAFATDTSTAQITHRPTFPQTKPTPEGSCTQYRSTDPDRNLPVHSRRIGSDGVGSRQPDLCRRRRYEEHIRYQSIDRRVVSVFSVQHKPRASQHAV